MQRYALLFLLALLAVLGCSSRERLGPDDSEPGYTELASAPIGQQGGDLTGGGLTISVPPGAFAAESAVSIAVSETDKPFGSEQVTPTYRISGLPEGFSQPLSLSLAYGGKSSPDEIFFALGEEGFCRSQADTQVRYRVLPGAVEGGRLSLEIPPPPDKGEAGSNGPAAGGFGFDCSIITGYTLYQTPEGHFRIAVPLSYLRNYVQMGQYLEEAYQRFLALGFSYAARSEWPVSVTLKTMDDDGGAMSSKLGDNHGYMEVSLRILDDLANLRSTCGHEFFHIVQGLYDPRAPMVQAAEPSLHYWLDEAAAVWSEELFTEAQDYSSPARNGHQMAPFRGMQAGAQQNARHHGYGMSAVIKHLVERHGQSVVPLIYGEIRSETHPVEAVCRDDPSGWWEAFLSDYMLGEVYNDVTRATWFQNAEEMWTIAGPADTLRTWSRGYPDLSGAIYHIRLSNPSFRPSDQMVFTLSGAEEGHLSVFRYNTTTLEFVAAGSRSVTVSDLQSMMAQGWHLFALVTNNLYDSPYTTERNITLKAHIPSGLDLSSATHCRIYLEDFHVTYRYTDGRTNPGILYRTFEVESGSWNGNTFSGTAPGSPSHEVSVTVDPATSRITAYSAKITSTQETLLIEGAIPVNPNTGDPYYLAEYLMTGQQVCTNTSNVEFSNSWGTTIVGWSCDAVSKVELAFW